MNIDVWRSVGLGLVAFALSAGLVPVVKRLALSKGIIDKPKQDRWHKTPTPYLGGVAIAGSALACSAFAPSWEVQGGVLLGAATFVGAVGLADDVRPVHPAVRVGIESAAATAAFFAGARTHLLGNVGDFILTVGWLVVITNSFNLLDNVDGAVGAIATTIAVALTIAAILEGQILVGALAAITAGACAGFLVHNWHPAKIFMGDAGSLFLGFLLAAIGLKLHTVVHPVAGTTAKLLLVGPALFDTALVVISRLAHRRPVLIGGTDHTSHRLIRLGMTPATSTLLLVGATASMAGLGVAVGRNVVPAQVAAVLTVVPSAAALGWLLRVPVYEPSQKAR